MASATSTVSLLSVFSRGRQVAICHLKQSNGVVKPVAHWEKSPSDKLFTEAFMRMEMAIKDRRYAVFNGVLQDKGSGDWTNTLSELVKSAGSECPSTVLPPRQGIELEGSFQLAESQGAIETDGYEEWGRFRSELSKNDDFSIRMLAFLQGVYELRSPVKKPPFWDISIEVMTEEDENAWIYE